MRTILGALIFVCIAVAASAQLEVTARSSEVSEDYLCGYGPDTYSGADSDDDNTLPAGDDISLVGSAFAEDEYLGNWWTATFDWDIAHWYTIDGGLSSAYRIRSAGTTTTQSAITGFATGTLNSALPGNLLELDFQTTASQDFWLRGSLAQSGPLNRNSASLVIYKWVEPTGFQSHVVRTQQNASFDSVITLAAGSYRITAAAVSHASATETAGASWDFELRAMPLASCPADLDLSGFVDAQDLSFLLAAFNVDETGDTDGDNDTDAQDLANLLAAFNSACP